MVNNILNQKNALLDSLRIRGFSEKIVSAFDKVKRENFIPSKLENEAYKDYPLQIGYGQTISQPYTIALMLNLLDLKDSQKVLEVGSGCGYVLALMSELVGKKGEVYGIEVIEELAEKSKDNLKLTDYNNITVYNRNGHLGLDENSPYDRIIMSAALDKIPTALETQLKENGLLVAPLNTVHDIGQSLVVFQKIKGELKVQRDIPGFIFVPFVDG